MAVTRCDRHRGVIMRRAVFVARLENASTDWTAAQVAEVLEVLRARLLRADHSPSVRPSA